ncbi:MAG: UbiA family prenyltransferase [archaeon]|nr:UbiA family prenyltransferase [archaeon]MCP8306488.1 UbiA family prenyltransferase [archaeon]
MNSTDKHAGYENSRSNIFLVGYSWRMLRLAKSRVSRASVFTWATFTGLIIGSQGRPTLSILLMALTSTFFMSLAVYVLNDIADLEVDMLNAPSRPLVTGAVFRKEAFILVLLSNGIGLSVALLINLPAFLVDLAVLLLSISYSAPRIALKDRFLIKTLSIGLGGALAMVFGGLAAGALNSRVLYATIIFFSFIFVSSPINDLADYIGDKMQGRRTIPIKIGPKPTVKLAMLVSISLFGFTLCSFSSLGFNLLAPILTGLVYSAALFSVYPLLKHHKDPKYVRKRHKRIVILHLLLQASLALGSF